MIELTLIFLMIGSLTIGGGLVAIPLIQTEVVTRAFITLDEFILMIGVAESTPGPIGINIATFVGFTQFGIIGALTVTLAFMLPSFILLTIVYNGLKTYRHTTLVNMWLLYLKAVVSGLILYAAIQLFRVNILNNDIPFGIYTLIIGLLLTIIGIKYHKKPWLIIISGLIFGIILFFIQS